MAKGSEGDATWVAEGAEGPVRVEEGDKGPTGV